MRHDPRAIPHERRRRQAVGVAKRVGMPPLARVGGAVLLLVVLVVVGSKWHVVPHTSIGRDNSYRDTACVIVLGIAGLRAALTVGTHRVSAFLAAVAGAVLLLGGIFATHDGVLLRWMEIVLGALAILAALTIWLSPEPALADQERRDRTKRRQWSRTRGSRTA